MKYIIYILFIVSLIFGNEELNSYLNDKSLKYQIIKDNSMQRIIVDLLYDKNKIIVFGKERKESYKKIFDEKIYFCNHSKYSNVMIKKEEQRIFIVCSIPNVDNGLYREFYSFENFENINSKLLSIRKQYINIDNDTIKNSYIFKPKKDIPTLKDYKNEKFSDKYLNENYKNFIKNDTNKKNILSEKQPLYKTPPIKTKMYLIKGDKVEILEEKDDWYYILYHGKKDIKAWIPKSAVE